MGWRRKLCSTATGELQELCNIGHTHTHRMKKEMVSKVNSVAGEFRKVSDLQMVETTKRTIRENVSISQQLSKMSEKTMALLRENEVLRRKETEMSRRVELVETSYKEITRKNVSSQKVGIVIP